MFSWGKTFTLIFIILHKQCKEEEIEKHSESRNKSSSFYIFCQVINQLPRQWKWWCHWHALCLSVHSAGRGDYAHEGLRCPWTQICGPERSKRKMETVNGWSREQSQRLKLKWKSGRGWENESACVHKHKRPKDSFRLWSYSRKSWINLDFLSLWSKFQSGGYWDAHIVACFPIPDSRTKSQRSKKMLTPMSDWQFDACSLIK